MSGNTILGGQGAHRQSGTQPWPFGIETALHGRGGWWDTQHTPVTVSAGAAAALSMHRVPGSYPTHAVPAHQASGSTLQESLDSGNASVQ